MKTIAILHGWASGKSHTKIFAKELTDSGFQIVEKPELADIIFAHSTGCYRIPAKNRAGLIVMNGLPYWPEKSIIGRLIRKSRDDVKYVKKSHGNLYLINKILWRILYVLIRPRLTYVALSKHKKLNFLEALKNRNVILVRNSKDNFMSPDTKVAVKEYPNIKFVEMPGRHDDHYTNPKPYIDLLLKHI